MRFLIDRKSKSHNVVISAIKHLCKMPIMTSKCCMVVCHLLDLDILKVKLVNYCIRISSINEKKQFNIISDFKITKHILNQCTLLKIKIRLLGVRLFWISFHFMTLSGTYLMNMGDKIQLNKFILNFELNI